VALAGRFELVASGLGLQAHVGGFETIIEIEQKRKLLTPFFGMRSAAY
jgi:hypothetical protein